MTKSQLVDAIAARTGLTRKQSTDAIEVSLAGFGKFSVAERAARQGVHPRTGDPMQIPATRVPRFTAGSNLKNAVRA